MTFPPLFEQRMKQLLLDDYAAFEAAYDTPLRRGVRVHTGKLTTERFRELFPCDLETSPFADNCFFLDTPHKAGADPLHHAGAYYMQEPSATSAVTVLNPLPGERILDLCAAPGGKSTQIAALLNGDGLLWSNEFVASRARILQQNAERWGYRNQVITNRDTSTLCQALEGYFDGVLVDAPCSGEGMFRKEPQALEEWSLDNIRLCAERQDEILDNAARAVRPGGRLVYSTCTFAPEENEGAVSRFLDRHPEFSLQPITVSFGQPGFSAERVKPFCSEVSDTYDLTYCRRILPYHGGEGHFIALFLRNEDGYAPSASPYPFPKKDPHNQSAEELYRTCFSDQPEGVFTTIGDTVYLLPNDLPDCRKLGVVRAGIAVATVCKNRLEPHHNLFMASRMENCNQTIDLDRNDPLLLDFLHGMEIPCESQKGWTAVCVNGIPVGFGKASGGRLKNRYPKGLRLL